jgi:glycosyltransferase involved in cell wall biosynthesis
VRNEAGFIGPCIEAIAQQDYPRDRFEVILLDGESTDGTVSEARAAAARHELRLVVETNRKRRTAPGFNLGLALARGSVIIKVDGHTCIDPTFISASVEALAEHDADAVGGPIRSEARTFAGRAIALAMASRFGIGDAAFRYSGAVQWTDSVAFGAYRRDVFERAGRFAEDIERGEDDEFNYRLRQAGGRILLTPAIGSVYYTRETLPDLRRQYWGYGLAKANVLLRHPGRLRPRHLVPSTFVLTLLLGAALSLVNRRFGWLALAAAAAYTIANLIASVGIATRHGVRTLRYVPFAFATIHLSAGTGMLVGLLQRAADRVRSRGE